MTRRAAGLVILAAAVTVGTLGGTAGPAAALCTGSSLCHIEVEPWIAGELVKTATGTLAVGQGAQAGAAAGVMALTAGGIAAWNIANIPTEELPAATVSGGDFVTSGDGVTLSALTGLGQASGARVTVAWEGPWPHVRTVTFTRRCSGGSFATDSSVLSIGTSSVTGSLLHGTGLRTCSAGYTITGLQVTVAPSGQVLAAAGDYADPASPATRTLEQSITCRRGDGTSHDITSSTTLGAWDGAGNQSIPELQCPTGEVALDWSADIVGSGTGERKRVGELHADDRTRALPQECLTRSDVCLARLEQLQPDGTWLSCHVDGVNCLGWWTSPLRDQDYRCRLGNAAVGYYAVGLRICSIYREPSVLTPMVTETPSPSTGSDGTCSIGFGDVLTGAIVYKAIVCALQWAFVPDPAVVQSSISQLQSAGQASAVGQISTALGNIIGPLTTAPPGSGSCQGPAVDLTWIYSGFTEPLHPLDVCTGLPAKIHAWALPFALVLLWVGALMSAWFFIAGAFGLQQ